MKRCQSTLPELAKINTIKVIVTDEYEKHVMFNKKLVESFQMETRRLEQQELKIDGMSYHPG